MFNQFLEEVQENKAAALYSDSAPTPVTVPIPDDFNANQTIINNTQVDLMVIDGIASSDTASEVLYEQNLKLLKSTTGSLTIKAGTSATFVLQDSYYDDDAKEWKYSYCYNLMIVQASNLFPVKIEGILPNDDWSAYDDITVTPGDEKNKIAGDWQNMLDSQAFQQNLMAYPDSLMAKQFATACDNSMNTSDSDDDIDTSVDSFFANTDSYKNVTLNSLTAIQTYWSVFPYIWAGYAATKSYYLYTSDSTTVSYVGSLDITAPTSAPASIDKSLTGFNLSFTPADTRQSKKNLQYIKGQFVDSVESTTVALKGIYQLKSQFTNVATDNTIMAFMSGSVNGHKVIGYNEKLTQDSQGNWSGLYTLLHPKDAAGWMALILEFGAVVMTLEMFSRPLKHLWDKYRDSKGKNKGEEPSKTDVEDMRADAKNKQTQDSAEAQRSIDRMAPEITIKIEINNYDVSINQVKTDRSNRVIEDTRSNYIDINVRQGESLKTLASIKNTSALQELGGKVHDNRVALDPANTTTEQLAPKLDEIKTTSSNLHDDITIEATKRESISKADQKAELSEAQSANEEALKLQEQIDKNKDASEEGDGGDVEMDDFPKGD